MKNCTYVFRILLCISVFVVAGILPGYSQQIEKGIRVSTGEYLGFLEYKPADYASKPTTKYPLIIFLHGIGERGNGTTELQKVACCGIPRIIKRGHNMKFTWNGKTETFIVLSPQSPKTYGMWGNHFIQGLIDYAKNNLRVDPNRIFLTGLSMGGGGTFKYISTSATQPQNLAAAATICAPCTFKEGKYVADAKLPFWGFHAADDAVAVASCTESAIRKINDQNPAVKPLKTIWPTGGHVVWDRVYTDTNYRYHGIVNIYEWFLAQNKSYAVNKLPVANAGGTINISASSGIATLDGSASSDPDGKIVRYVWKKIEGPAVGTISHSMGSKSSTTVTGLTTPGVYKFELNVVDDRASFTSDVLTVVVSSGASIDNNAPLAKAGTDVTITLPVNRVDLNGLGSSDADGSIASYSWTKVSGSTASITAPSNATTSVTNLTVGTYVFKLKVTDNKGATSEDQVTVTVKAAPTVSNKTPIARAGINFSITLPDNTIELDASGSEDEDGTISLYQWTKLSGPSATIESPSSARTVVKNLVQGTYIFKLKVTDNGGSAGYDEITVVVNPAANKAPVASAGTDITITLPTNKTTLNGAGSNDADGTIATYLWTKIGGPGTFRIVSATSPSTELNSLVEGTYQFILKVTDNKGATDEDVVTVIVNPAANIKPVANAGNDITITLPVNKTVLNGSNSDDQDGTIESYDWTWISGPQSYIVADGTVAKTNLSNLSEGTYLFRLQVTDNKGAKDADTVKVTVLPAPPAPNAAPVAQAGANISVTLPNDNVTLDGSSSSDGDGTIQSYYWSFIEGPQSFIIEEPGSVITPVTALIQGDYTFKLEVTDNDGATSADTINVYVRQQDLPAPNIRPLAIAGEDISITLPVDAVTLDGTASNDEDGTLTNYSWLKIEGPDQFKIASPSYHITQVENLIEGTYRFRLQVKDNEGALAYDTITVTVLHALNITPVSKAGADIQVRLPINETQVSGSDSYDPDGSVAKYKWEYVSGPSTPELTDATSVSTSVKNLVEGEYVLRLTVTDNNGKNGSDVVRITVLPEPPNVSPVAIAGADVEAQLPDPVIKLDGRGSYDPDGTIEEYSWVNISGPGGATITNSTSATPSIVGVIAGEYHFRLTVKDDKGQAASDVVKVVINPAPEVENQKPVAYAGDDQTIAYLESSVTLDGKYSGDNDGTIDAYEWTLVSGPSQAKIVNPSHVSTEVSGLQTGEYQFELYVKDDKGAISRDTIRISVVNTMRYEEQMSTYPNPAVSTINVQLTSDTMGLAKITLYNSAGTPVKTVSKQKTQPQLFENINVSNLQTGMYYVEVIIGGKLRKTAKTIIRK